MKQEDYLYKDLVGEWSFTTIGKNIYVQKSINLDGREYCSLAKAQSVTAMTQVYKIWDSDEKKHVYKLFVGVVKQHPRERCSKKIAIEQAKIKVMSNPDLVATWDKKNSFKMLANFVENYIDSFSVKSLQTTAEAKRNVNVNNKYGY